MEWTVLSYALLAIFVSVSAKPNVSSSEQGISMQPDPAAVLNNGKAVSKGVQLMLHVFMKEADSQLKEPFNLSQGHLEEQIKDGDSLLRERILNGIADVREELKEGDDRLKEEIDNDVAQLKGKVEKEQSRLKEEVAEVKAKVNQTMEWKEDYDHLEHTVKELKESTRSEVDDLRNQMLAIQLELNDTKTLLTQLQSTQADRQEKLRNHSVALPENSDSTWCPDGWTSHEGFCFFISNEMYTWVRAKGACEKMGGYLAEVSSASRHEFLTGLIESHGLTKNRVWIGLYDLVEENVFVWSHSGQKLNVNFWEPQEPNNEGNDEDCVAVYDRLWNDLPCNVTVLSYHFICEKTASEEMIG